MNALFLFLIAFAYGSAAWQQFLHPERIGDAAPMDLLTQVIFQSSNDAIQLAIGLIGVMAFFLGLMRVAEQAGLLQFLARLLSPFLRRLFPEVPQHHPAHGAIVMNLSANMLGLGNAATPFGIQAMQSLEELNPKKGTASNAMIMFLAINTSSVTLLPTKVIALRVAAGSHDPAGIVLTTLFATLISTVVAISLALLCQRFSKGYAPLPKQKGSQASFWLSVLGMCLLTSFIPITFIYGQTLTPWIIPSLTVGILSYGYLKKIAIYEVFVDGAKEGFQVAVKIMPYLAAILVAVGLVKASGTLDAFIHLLSPYTAQIGLPAEALPMVLMRPLSGSGSLGILSATLQDPNIGPDSYVGYLVSTLMGCTETTFYVVAVYFGAVQIKKIRHAIWIGLCSDLAGVLASVAVVSYLFS